jgi:predicted chitinase
MANTTPPNTATPPLKKIAFAFPFRKKGQGNGASATDITDEHDMYLLLKQEPSGSFPVSASGMWHGGIHISEAGAGQGLDIKGGVRCIADGEVIAWRLNRNYLVSTLPPQNGQPEANAQYSTGFALVQHSMEFPRGKKLTFFSLYMHLQDYAAYEADPALPWPGYWSAKYQVTQDTVDKPTTSAGGQAASADQTGLRVRATRPHGDTVGILPQGTLVSLSRREGDWGQIAEDPGALIAAAVGGYVASSAAKGKWIFLGKEHGQPGPVVKSIMPDSVFDCVNVVPEAQRTTVKAGDVLGYLGRYDSLRDQTSNRIVHIEVFSDDSIRQFIVDGRAGVNANITTPANWNQLGLSADPTVLRIAADTTLYDKDPVAGTPPQASTQAKQTDVIQVEAFAVLQNGTGNSFLETRPGNDGQKRHWWKVGSADLHRHAVSGWVREQSFAGGRVTQEYSQSWIDFECHDEDHDPAHTIFASTADYVAYAKGSDDPSAGSIGKLSPLMSAIYRVLYPTGDGAHAVEDLRNAGQNPQGSAFPWVAFRASRLIPKHESEWANPAKWQELVGAIEQSTGPQPEHEEEKKRIAKLVWWDEVKAGVTGFPESDVFHIHPVALVGNFFTNECLCAGHELTAENLKKIAPGATDGNIQRYISTINKAFSDFKVDACIARAHFLAQAFTESGSLSATREHGGHLSYDPWRGRGLIQVTFQENYQAYGDYVHEDLTSNAAAIAKLEQSPHAVLSAYWYYFIHTGLMSDSVADDFLWITRKINGAYTGYDERLKFVNKAIEVLNLKGCTKLNRDGVYRFEESKAYSEKRASCAWGMWNDPGLNKHGIAAKSRAEAIKGYHRYIELDIAAGSPVDAHGHPKDQGWYGLAHSQPVRPYVEGRLQILNSMSN